MSDIEKSMKYPFGIHLSYAFGSFFDDFIMTAFSIRVYSFYETELFLDPWLISIAVIIYGVWNMFNDPFAGYISDIPFRFTQKRGKRFTWFLLTSIPTAIIYLLIFMPPGNYPTLYFIWLLVLICLYDTFFSFWNTNWMGIFPVKFRSQRERTQVGGIQVILSQIGLTLGMLVPPMLFTYGQPSTYIYAALFVTITSIGAILIMIPGMREKQIITEPLMSNSPTNLSVNYFRTLKGALKEKNFRAYLTAYLGQTVMMTVMLASVPYLVKYVLNLEESAEIYISGAVLVGGLLSVPVWINVGRKFGNRIGYMCGTGLTALVLIVFFFISNLTGFIISALIVGFTMGATWSLIYPCFADVIDEIVVKTKTRHEGIYYGFRTFIGRFSIVIQAATFGFIHWITGFNATLSFQEDPAIWGIRIHTALVPALFYFLGFLAMWLFYDLKPAKTRKIKEQLLELNL